MTWQEKIALWSLLISRMMRSPGCPFSRETLRETRKWLNGIWHDVEAYEMCGCGYSYPPELEKILESSEQFITDLVWSWKVYR